MHVLCVDTMLEVQNRFNVTARLWDGVTNVEFLHGRNVLAQCFFTYIILASRKIVKPFRTVVLHVPQKCMYHTQTLRISVTLNSYTLLSNKLLVHLLLTHIG